jgi:hypothetical protein
VLPSAVDRGSDRPEGEFARVHAAPVDLVGDPAQKLPVGRPRRIVRWTQPGVGPHGAGPARRCRPHPAGERGADPQNDRKACASTHRLECRS